MKQGKSRLYCDGRSLSASQAAASLANALVALRTAAPCSNISCLTALSYRAACTAAPSLCIATSMARASCRPACPALQPLALSSCQPNFLHCSTRLSACCLQPAGTFKRSRRGGLTHQSLEPGSLLSHAQSSLCFGCTGMQKPGVQIPFLTRCLLSKTPSRAHGLQRCLASNESRAGSWMLSGLPS